MNPLISEMTPSNNNHLLELTHTASTVVRNTLLSEEPNQAEEIKTNGLMIKLYRDTDKDMQISLNNNAAIKYMFPSKDILSYPREKRYEAVFRSKVDIIALLHSGFTVIALYLTYRPFIGMYYAFFLASSLTSHWACNW